MIFLAIVSGITAPLSPTVKLTSALSSVNTPRINLSNAFSSFKALSSDPSYIE